MARVTSRNPWFARGTGASTAIGRHTHGGFADEDGVGRSGMILFGLVACGGALGCDVSNDELPTAAPLVELADGEDLTEGEAPDVPTAEAPSSCAATGSGFEGVEPISSRVAVGRMGEASWAVVADRDDRALVAVALDSPSERARIDLPGRPEQVLIAPDGRVITTLADRDEVLVHELGPAGFTLRCRRATSAEPAGMAFTDAGLLVVSRWDARLTLFEGEELTSKARVSLPRDPYAVAVSRDGDFALISHVVGGKVSKVALSGADLGPAETVLAQRHEIKRSRSMKFEPRPMRKPMNGPGGFRGSGVSTVETTRVAQQAFAITRVEDGRFVMPASLADPTPAPRGGAGYGGGGMAGSTPPHQGVNLELDPSGTFDLIGHMHRFSGQRFFKHRCLLPRGAAYDDDTKTIWVVCRGSRAVLGFTRDGRDGKTGLRLPRKVVEVAAGPVGIAIDRSKRRLVVWSEDAGVVSLHALPETLDRPAQPQQTSVAEVAIVLKRYHPLDEKVVLGRHLFHLSARRTANDGRACASCHPSGRDDGMTWITEDGPRQTPILAGRLDPSAKPFGWNGRNDELDGHLQRTLKRLRGTGLKREERDAIFAYVQQMWMPPPPKQEAELAAKGRRLFEDSGVGCATCHGLEVGTTDGRQHALGMVAKRDRLKAFDTPSLRFVAGSAPYFHDGRYPTLGALLADEESNMGHASDLDGDDRQALEAFVRTL